MAEEVAEITETETNDKDWVRVAFRIGISAAVHPLEYARILIQLGYEPVPPHQTYTFFGRPTLGLPNIFQYSSYIRKNVGFFGLYRGLTARICMNLTNGYVYEQVSQNLAIRSNYSTEDDDEKKEETETEKIVSFIQDLLKDVTAKSIAVIVSHPFQVITVRTIAQFVGGEEKYRGIFSSLREIYHEDGIRGYFSGLTPRLLGEILSICIAESLTYVLKKIITDKDLAAYIKASMGFIASAVTYPFVLVSNVMAVNNSGLAAGNLPHMPIYVSWKDCWSHLKSQKQLKRGASVLVRYYKGPYILEGGLPKAVSLDQFQSPARKSKFV